MPSSRRILFVDDESDITTIMKNGLEGHGFDVDAFNDPRQALSHFKPDYYGIIMLDVRMPAMSGFELAREIWKNEPDARICFLTAFEIYQNEAKKVFPTFKTFCFIKKPVTINALVKHIQLHFA